MADLSKTSNLLKMFAKANKICGYDDYAKILEDSAVVYEAKEILEEDNKKGNNNDSQR